MVSISVLSGCVGNKGQSSEANQSYEKENSGSGQVTLQWNDVPNVKSYNVYYSKSPGVNKRNGDKILNAANPVTIKDLTPGATYYFVVTAVNEFGESEISEEILSTVSK